MKQKSWHIDRRTMLRGAGAALALPLLDSMVWAGSKDAATIAQSKKRFCAFYFPYGVTVSPAGNLYEKWNWYPKDLPDGSYEFNEVLKPLNSLKQHVTVFNGIRHAREMGGHDSADGFLTGTPVTGGKAGNTISMDQVLANQYGDQTRFASMVLSLEGGIGAPSRSFTLSYNKDGLPIPAESDLRRIFNRMFSTASQNQMLAELNTNKSILDNVLESSKTLKGKVGKQDQQKVDQYLSSVRDLEKRIQKQEAWIGKPLPKVDASGLHLDASVGEPQEYMESMLDLIYLAFQTDMTRYATFQIGSQGNNTLSTHLLNSLSLGSTHHNLAHGMNKGDGAEKYGKYLQYLTGIYGKFLTRLKETPEDGGTMLDHTLSMYGCSNGNPTHSCANVPLVLSGGEAMGFKQGQYLKSPKGQIRLTNLYATILNRMGAPVQSFADSTGMVDGVLKG